MARKYLVISGVVNKCPHHFDLYIFSYFASAESVRYMCRPFFIIPTRVWLCLYSSYFNWDVFMFGNLIYCFSLSFEISIWIKSSRWKCRTGKLSKASSSNQQYLWMIFVRWSWCCGLLHVNQSAFITLTPVSLLIATLIVISVEL